MILALLIAVALHAMLLTLPLSPDRNPPPYSAPIRITIVQPPVPESAPAPTEAVGPPGEPALPTKSESPVGAVNPADTALSLEKQTVSTAPAEEVSGTIDQPLQTIAPDPGAKSRSTVFDPRLAEKLARERKRVQKFDSRDTEHMTSTGTFVQQGDRCWEVKKLLPDDIDSNLTQDFNVKCTKRRRPGDDIDRLARKYGIP
ncbi:hypothetical protein [Microbulbifer taiwanensis]|uniref:Uncharacterized protein n=1 Tax=Microbulbifer taiwanensis TaxID=986746 RepID=A0ABW1YTJ9_9GAMM|nr:hypothetical protein [Microbulbifer taiwanensis]